MRTILMLVLVTAACADDPHDLVTCDPAWGFTNAKECELACQAPPPNNDVPGQDQPCQSTRDPANGETFCDRTFVFSGVRGCCKGVATGGPEFVECE